MKTASGIKALIIGFSPMIMPKFGRIDDIIKNEMPMNKPITILLLAFVVLIFPKIMRGYGPLRLTTDWFQLDKHLLGVATC